MVPLNTVHRFFNDGDEDIEFAVELKGPRIRGSSRVSIFSMGLRVIQMGDTRWPGLVAPFAFVASGVLAVQ
jgi:hypothetical protein